MHPLQPSLTAAAQEVRVPIRDAATAQQTNTVLGVMSVTLSALAALTRIDLDMEDHDEPPDRRHVLTGEPRIAAEMTFIECCKRLDSMLQDDDRWTMRYQNKMEQDRQRMVDTQIALNAAQAKLTNEMTSPHFRYRPAVARAVDGDWVAFIGDPEDLRNAIVGAGKTPQAAIDDFDSKFDEKIPAVVQEWLADYETKLNAGEQPSPFPSLINNVHDNAIETDSGTEDQRSDGPADSDEDGPGIPAGN